MENPKLIQKCSLVIDKLSVHFDTNISEFENEFCRLIALDKSSWDRSEMDSSMVTIVERRIKIGVHNGWTYLNEPHVVQLAIDDSSFRRSSLSNKRSGKSAADEPKK